MTKRQWSRLFKRLLRESEERKARERKLRLAGYDNAAWHPRGARRPARGWAAQIMEE